ncbi:hypothetical protein AAKU67_003679 [Oxalobacteraceae bacterium GrIS 2.11]
MLKIQSTTSFNRVVKKLHHNDKADVDDAVSAISADITKGEEKRGDLSGVFVYKFKMNKQEMLLAYKLELSKFNPEEIVLLALGSRENFYAYLKNEISV